MRLLTRTLVIAGIALGVVQAHAAVVTKTYSFSLGGFTDVNSAVPVSPPFASASGSFTVTFDPTLSYVNNTSLISVGAYSGPTVDSALGFSYFKGSKLFSFGGVANGTNVIVAGKNDFALLFTLDDLDNPVFLTCASPGIGCGTATGDPNYSTAGYTRASSNKALWLIGTPQSSVTSVPEPTSLALVALGVLGAAVAHRRPTRRTAV